MTRTFRCWSCGKEDKFEIEAREEHVFENVTQRPREPSKKGRIVVICKWCGKENRVEV